MPAIRNRPFRGHRERNRLVDLLMSRIDGSSHDHKTRSFAASYAPAVYPSPSVGSSFDQLFADHEPNQVSVTVTTDSNDKDVRDDHVFAVANSSSSICVNNDDNETAASCRGIPMLAKRFRTFDPLNDPAASNHEPLEPHRLRFATERDFYHLDRYLLAAEFNADRLLRKRDTDHVACAIYSFALDWDEESLQRYASRSTAPYKFTQLPPPRDEHALPTDSREAVDRRRAFVAALSADRDSSVTCFVHPDGFAYSRSTFRSLTRALNADACGADEQRLSPLKSRPFRLTDHLPYWFREELDRLHRALVNDEPWLATWEPARVVPIPYDLQRRLGSYEGMKRAAVVKFVTGQACCGKTSVLNRLRSRGWMVFSRGALGSFAGKASDPLAVFGLHAAIDWTLRRDNALGVSICSSLASRTPNLCPRSNREHAFRLLAGPLQHRQSAVAFHHAAVRSGRVMRLRRPAARVRRRGVQRAYARLPDRATRSRVSGPTSRSLRQPYASSWDRRRRAARTTDSLRERSVFGLLRRGSPVRLARVHRAVHQLQPRVRPSGRSTFRRDRPGDRRLVLVVAARTPGRSSSVAAVRVGGRVRSCGWHVGRGHVVSACRVHLQVTVAVHRSVVASGRLTRLSLLRCLCKIFRIE